MSETIWLMDTDFCCDCGGELADVDGVCWWCYEQRITPGEDRLDDDEYWEDYDVAWYFMQESQS